MSIEVLLDLIRKRFSASESQTILGSLQQDPLVWQFIKEEEKSLPYFESAPTELISYSPGKIAVWLIEQAMEISHLELASFDSKLPDSIKQHAVQAYETVRNSCLPPVDLMSAGLLALTLRERRITKGTWQGISDEIIIKRNHHAILKNFRIWRTPLACLRYLCPDFEDFLADFIQSQTASTVTTSIPLFIHTTLASPLESGDLLDHLFSFTKNLPIDLQLESLKWLESFHKPKLRENLAKNLIQSKNNINFLAQVFSELEMLDTNTDESDPLDKQVRYTLAEDINRLAAFYFYSGNNEKAINAYQKSYDLLDFVKSQTLFQTLSINRNQTPPSGWLKLIQSVPNSTKARNFYIQSLMDVNNYEEAFRHIKDLPASPEKHLFQLRIEGLNGAQPDLAAKSISAFTAQPTENIPNSSNYYVHSTNFNPAQQAILEICKLEGSKEYMPLVEKILAINYNDLGIVELARDYYEQIGQFEQAVELTSYLERMVPDDNSHKRALARLYSLEERWQDAFITLQETIKSTHSPTVNDLERFAESALKTDRFDMSISICQNILKQDPHNVKALILLGEGYMGKGDVVKAIQHIEQVVEMIPEEPETWLTLTRLWQNSGQTDRAFEILNQGILALPNDPDLLRALGKAHLEKQAPSDAVTYLRKAYEIEPDNIDGKFNLAAAMYQIGEYEQAHLLLKPYMQIYEENALAAKLLGQVLIAMDQRESAEPILISAAEKMPEDLETVLTAAQLFLTKIEASLNKDTDYELDRIKKVLQNSLSHHPEDPQINLYLTDINRLKGKFQQAFDSYTNLSKDIHRNKGVPDWRLQYGLGKAAVALGNHDIGLAVLQDAASKQPENLMILHSLAEAYQIADIRNRAHDTAKSALMLAPQEINNILWYADFKSKSNEPEEAVKALKEARQINPDQPELKLWLSKMLILIGSLEEAKEILFDLISNVDKSNDDELHQAAYVCVHLNEFDLASIALEKSTQQDQETDPILIMDQAVIYSLMGKHKKALKTLALPEEVIKKHPQLALLKSDLFCNLGQYASAINVLHSIEQVAEDALDCIVSDPGQNNSSPLLYNHNLTLQGYFFRLGQLNRGLGDLLEAQKNFNTALSFDPDDIRLQNAALEAYFVGMEFDYALNITTSDAQTDTTFYARNRLDCLDLACSKAELRLMRNEEEQTSALLNSVSQISENYPRVLAIQSQLAAKSGKIDDAEDLLNQAQKSYQENFAKIENLVLTHTFRQMMILSSIAEAALKLDKYQTACQYQQQASRKLTNQPLINWRYALTLIRSAESQQIANAVYVTNHSPGNLVLSEEYQHLSHSLLENLHGSLSKNEKMCLQARADSAFSRSWPLTLSADACLVGPEEAASVILGSDDDSFVHDILESYPADPKVLQAYGIFALRNNKDDGISIVEKALTQDTSNPINYALLALLYKNDAEQALNSWETALSFWPDEPEWHALAADLLAQTGNPELASQHITTALKHQPQNSHYWQKSAEIKILSDDLSQAIKDLEMSTTFESQDPNVWMKMAEVNRRMGNVKEATNNIHTASSLNPDNINIAIKEVQFLIEDKHFKEAEIKAEAILQKEGQNDHARILLARSQSKQGKFDKALETLASGKNRNNTEIKLENLKIRKHQEGIKAVLPTLISLAQNNPEHPAVLTTLTDWLIQTNQLEKAAEAAQTILRIIPDHAEVHLMLGRLQKKAGQLDQAIAHLSDAIAYDPTLIEAYIELGKTYQERRDLEAAIKVFQKGSTANASDPRPYYFAGMALKECKDYSSAESMLKQAKKYSPDDANIIRQLGVVTALNLVNNLREAR